MIIAWADNGISLVACSVVFVDLKFWSIGLVFLFLVTFNSPLFAFPYV